MSYRSTQSTKARYRSPLQPYVNIINEAFDATHEREWRYVGDLRFSLEELRFVFCPESDFGDFA